MAAKDNKGGIGGGGWPAWLWAMGGLTSSGPLAAAMAAAIDVGAFGVLGGVGGWPEALLLGGPPPTPPMSAAESIPDGKLEAGEATLGGLLEGALEAANKNIGWVFKNVQFF